MLILVKTLCTSIKAQSYPSERAALEQEKVQNQLEAMSTVVLQLEMNEIENRKEPLIAFRATGVKDSGTSPEQPVDKNPGTSIIYRPKAS